MSCNTGNFASLHRQWLTQGRLHSGILIIRQQWYSTGEIVHGMLRAGQTESYTLE
jgi:hypothetical protein